MTDLPELSISWCAEIYSPYLAQIIQTINLLDRSMLGIVYDNILERRKGVHSNDYRMAGAEKLLPNGHGTRRALLRTDRLTTVVLGHHYTAKLWQDGSPGKNWSLLLRPEMVLVLPPRPRLSTSHMDAAGRIILDRPKTAHERLRLQRSLTDLFRQNAVLCRYISPRGFHLRDPDRLLGECDIIPA